MLVFLKQNLVILSVPKTGTTAYMQALAPHADFVIGAPPQLKHASLRRYQRFFAPMFARTCGRTPQVAAVVREPVDWLGSWYRYRQRPALRGHINSTHAISFDHFVAGYLSNPQPQFADVGSQARFLRAGVGKGGVDHLFRYEDQARYQAFLRDRLGISVTPGAVNVSPAADLALPDDLRQRLERALHADRALYHGINAIADAPSR